jgi:CHAT domain-containing protein
VFDPAERAIALAARARLSKQAAKNRPTAARAYSDFWQGAGADRAELARGLPSLLDTADELKAVAAKLGAPAADIHLASDASETTVKRTSLVDYRVVYFATHGLVAGEVKGPHFRHLRANVFDRVANMNRRQWSIMMQWS